MAAGTELLRENQVRRPRSRNVTARRRNFLGDLLGIAPTGRRVRWDAVDVYRLRDGKISEEWAADDLTAILHAVGAYTPPWIS